MDNKVVREIISWIMVFVIAFALAFIIKQFVLFKVEIPSGSMENTLMIDDKAFIYRLSYLFHDPERGDVIVFPWPDNEKMDYIKRIIGLPGETVEGIDGLVYIDGEPLDEPYVKDKIDEDFGPFVVPEKSYFMMGDNRNNSKDSRYWVNTYVSRDKIMGKAIFKYPNYKWLY